MHAVFTVSTSELFSAIADLQLARGFKVKHWLEAYFCGSKNIDIWCFKSQLEY